MNNYRSSTPKRHRRNKVFPWLVCALGGIFYGYEYLLRVSPGVMSQQVIKFFNTDAAGFGVLAGSYYYIYAVMQLFVGILIDSYGPRRLMSLACLCCAIGIALFAATSYFYLALIGRFLIGFGSAFAFVGVLKLAAIWLPERFFALISGLTTTLGMIGGISGDILLTHLVKVSGWRASCFYSALFGVLLAVAILVLIKKARAYYLHRKIPKQLPSIAHNFDKLLSLLGNKYLWINGIIAGCLYMSVPVFADSWGITYLTENLHFSHTTAALMCSTIYLGWAFGAPFSGWLTECVKRRRLPLLIGAVLTLLVTLILLFVSRPSSHVVFILCFLMGFFSSVEVINFAVARDMTSVQNTGSAVAITNMLLMVSGWFVALTGLILKIVSPPTVEGAVVHYSHLDYQISLSILPLSLLLAIALLFIIPETHSSCSNK